MASYNVIFKPSVEKDLRSLPKAIIARVMSGVEGLKSNPFPRQATKLAGTERLHRLRVGDYRVIYEVDVQALRITVHYIRHRREVYNKL